MADGRNRLLSIAQAAMLCNPAPCRVAFSKKKGAPRAANCQKNLGEVSEGPRPLRLSFVSGGFADGAVYSLPKRRKPLLPHAEARPAPVALCPATNQVCQKNAYAGSAHRHNQPPPGEHGNRAQPQPGCQETTHRRAGNAQQQVAKQANASIHAHHQGGKPTRQRAKDQLKKQRHENPPPLPFILRWRMAIHALVFLTPRGLKAEEFPYFTDRAAQGAKGISMPEGHCVGCKTVQKAWKMV